MNFCANCGAKIEEGAVFCEHCGRRVEPGTPPVNQGYPSANYSNQTSTVVNYQAPQQPSTGANYRAPEQQMPPVSTPVAPKGKNTLLIVLLIVAFATLMVAAGFLGYQFIFNKGTDEVVTVAPTPTPAPTGDPEAIVLEEEKRDDLLDMDEINRILAGVSSDTSIGVCVYDVKNDATYSAGVSDRAMSASALVNIPVLYTVSEDLKAGNITWNSNILFQFLDKDGRGALKKEDDGQYFNVTTLTQYMLNYSDNNATNSLMDHYGMGYIEEVCANGSYNSVRVERYLGILNGERDNYISADDATGMLADMYRSEEGMVDRSYLQKFFKIEDSAKNAGIGKYLPSGITFLNHNAVTSTVYNESAIISSEDAEYVITVLSEGPKPETQKTVIADLAWYVHNTLSQAGEE